tara:strand:- start:1124 stop:1318 length:195 start_codon:yes stop_codon:yes gene_type:complete
METGKKIKLVINCAAEPSKLWKEILLQARIAIKENQPLHPDIADLFTLTRTETETEIKGVLDWA